MRSKSLNVLFTQAQRKVIADLLPEFTDRLKLDEKNPRTISFTTKELDTIRRKAETARPHAQNGMIRNSLRHVVDAVTKALEEAEGIGSIPASERLYQFKITLLESQPRIWRRIQVKDSSLDKLHERIQTAMGWTNSHLHQFEIDGERYGDPELLDDGFEDFECVDSTVTKISKIVPKDGKRFQFTYEYDFGD
ncbi:MAG: plasmid pRiA4b ORF-3 family protein, partial [Planctomycetales bacterium]